MDISDNIPNIVMDNWCILGANLPDSPDLPILRAEVYCHPEIDHGEILISDTLTGSDNYGALYDLKMEFRYVLGAPDPKFKKWAKENIAYFTRLDQEGIFNIQFLDLEQNNANVEDVMDEAAYAEYEEARCNSMS